MRKMILIVAAVFVLTLPVSAWADPYLAPGFEFDYTTSITMGGQTVSYGDGGGPFYSTLNGTPDVLSYCVQTGVYFTPGLTYMVDLYKEVGDPRPEQVNDPVIGHASDWFWFASYDINTYGLDKNNSADQIATQYAVWVWSSMKNYADVSARAIEIYDTNPPNMTWDDSGYRYADLYTIVNGVRIEAQDQIVRVPEPMTMLLLGLGLIGVAGIRRKFKG